MKILHNFFQLFPLLMVDCVTMLSYDDNIPEYDDIFKTKENYTTEFFASIKDMSSLSMADYYTCDDIFVIYINTYTCML